MLVHKFKISNMNDKKSYMYINQWSLLVVSTWLKHVGSVAGSLVSANRSRGIKIYRFPWYLMVVSANHASSNPAWGKWVERGGVVQWLGCWVFMWLPQVETPVQTSGEDLLLVVSDPTLPRFVKYYSQLVASFFLFLFFFYFYFLFYFYFTDLRNENYLHTKKTLSTLLFTETFNTNT